MKYSFIEINDLKKYKKDNLDCCRMIISPGGKVYKAEPSQINCLMIIMAHKLKMTDEQFMDWSFSNTSSGVKLNWMSFLVDNTHWVPVWKNFYIGEPNSNQYNSLLKLRKNHIYSGSIKPKNKKNKKNI